MFDNYTVGEMMRLADWIVKAGAVAVILFVYWAVKSYNAKG